MINFFTKITLCTLIVTLMSCSSINKITENLNNAWDSNFGKMLIVLDGTEKEVIFKLNETRTTATTANFKKLINQNFYQGIHFHRIIPGFIVQAGDPNARDLNVKKTWGLGGPGYELEPEISLTHQRGSLAMARLGDNINPDRKSNGSQFYVALQPLTVLDGKYTVFGKVIKGMDVIDEIASLSVDDKNVPLKPAKITKMQILSASEAEEYKSLAQSTEESGLVWKKVGEENDAIDLQGDTSIIKKKTPSNNEVIKFLKNIW